MRACLPIALLLLAPVALAGTAEDPDLTDATGDASTPAANAWADVTAAWIETSGNATRAWIQLASLDTVPPGTGYLAVFDVRGSSHYAGLVTLPPVDEMHYVSGPWDRETDFPADGGEDTTGEFSPGAPALIGVDLVAERLGNATSIENLSLRVFDYKSAVVAGQDFVMLDTADGGRAVTLASAMPAADAASDETAATPAPGLVPLVAAALAGLALARRRAGTR